MHSYVLVARLVVNEDHLCADQLWDQLKYPMTSSSQVHCLFTFRLWCDVFSLRYFESVLCFARLFCRYFENMASQSSSDSKDEHLNGLLSNREMLLTKTSVVSSI